MILCTGGWGRQLTLSQSLEHVLRLRIFFFFFEQNQSEGTNDGQSQAVMGQGTETPNLSSAPSGLQILHHYTLSHPFLNTDFLGAKFAN